MQSPGTPAAPVRILDSSDIDRALVRISHQVVERNRGDRNLVLVGIRTRGVPLAQRLASIISGILGAEISAGAVDVSQYRDDYQLGESLTALEMHGTPDGRDVVLVDDVLYTGRTVRAAMDALTDAGRARTIQLAVLIDRGHRELPIRADYVGKNLPTSHAERVSVMIPPVDETAQVMLERIP